MPISKYHRVYKFKNGATLIYFKHNVNNTTRVTGGFISGAQKDIIPGTAHFLEHMMGNLGDKQDLVRRSDIHTNAFTTSSCVCFELNIPNKHLDKGFDVLKYMTFNNDFDPSYFENERKAILQENILYSQEIKHLNDLYNSSYTGQKILGSEKDINKITIKDIQDYKKENFVSENYVICVTSSLDFDTIKQQVEETIISNLPSDPSKRNTPLKAKKIDAKSYFVYEPIANVKTLQLTFALVSNMSIENVNIYEYVDNFIFNDSFSGLLLDKFRTEKGLVYSAQMHNELGDNNNVYKVFTVTTSKEHVNEIIETLAEVLDIARQGMSEKEYADYISKLKTIETDRRVQQKFLDSSEILQRYMLGCKLWFNNPVHKAVKMTREQINNYLSKTYKNKPIYFDLLGDFDIQDVYSPMAIQKMTKSKRFELVKETFGKNVCYYSSKTGEDVDEKEFENESKHKGSVQIKQSQSEGSANELLLALANATLDERLLMLERISKAVGVDDLELRLKEFNSKRKLIEAFARKLNVALDLIQGTMEEIASGNEDADETLQKLRELPLSTRLELIKKYAAKYKLILNFGSQNADKQEESNSQEKSNNQEEIQK